MDYTDVISYNDSGIILCLIAPLLFLSTVTITLRFIARYKQKNGLGVDDILALLAWICFVGLSSTSIFGVAQGHLVQSNEQFWNRPHPGYLAMNWFGFLFSLLGTGFTRLSALYFYRRLFNSKMRWDLFEIVTAAVIALVIMWMIAFFVLQFFACGDHFAWLFDGNGDFSYPDSHEYYCMNSALSGIFSRSTAHFVWISAILDVLVLVLPFPKIWSLHMRLAQKLAVSLVFILAAMATAASCVRILFTMDATSNGWDIMTGGTRVFWTMILEAGTGVVAVNLPSARYLFVGFTRTGFWQKLRSLTRIRSTSSSKTKDSLLPTRVARNNLIEVPPAALMSGADTELDSDVSSEFDTASLETEIRAEAVTSRKPAII